MRPQLRLARPIVTLLAVPILIAGGCAQHDLGFDAANGTSHAVLSDSHLGVKKKPEFLLFDGFEGDAIANFWLPKDYGSGRYEAGAVAISRSFARSGTGSVRITVREGDIEQRGDDGLRTERAELDSGKHPLLRRDVWYGFSFLLPSGFPVVDNRLVIAQWKQDGTSGSPLVAQRFRKGAHYLTVRIPKATFGEDTRFPMPQIIFGRWNDMIYHLRFSASADGCVEVWMNGVQVVSYSGRTAFEEGKNSFYQKIGLYRDRWTEPMTIYFDNYTLSDSRNAVDPARFDADRQRVEQGAPATGVPPRR
jgi:polysaccharide lyase-like protein